mmetsp:Transcript_15482/g.17853  ORF Transcript_15482/g.17853 Transcript_15482/m.17853 type:complete len:108 (-) Transcript_15482:1112-1435(-)|eukprot:CAMPEP_0176418552 /NCGR_PEP_ID=MMETSP0127-20121128/7532_1 /TAXON_ID=938130 /ORGANISM="Platyophrya macrostoma, Strain WH" /LENGTH=107 /DNA_ID=CAMNT_0017798885 /DNA_START=469 /DNA_END=792 /DNA_ORIENTATION=+
MPTPPLCSGHVVKRAESDVQIRTAPIRAPSLATQAHVHLAGTTESSSAFAVLMRSKLDVLVISMDLSVAPFAERNSIADDTTARDFVIQETVLNALPSSRCAAIVVQ